MTKQTITGLQKEDHRDIRVRFALLFYRKAIQRKRFSGIWVFISSFLLLLIQIGPLNPKVTAAEEFEILQSGFDANSGGFIYVDDPFRGTSAPGYADGSQIDSGGFSGGALQVILGDIDDADIFGMSGGWQQSFNLIEPTAVVVSFRYNLIQAPDYESDELSQVLLGFNGTLFGQGAGGFVAQIVGNGNGGSAQTTGWQLFEASLGIVSAGNYTLTIGGYNNQKTFNNESTEVLIDELLVTGAIPEGVIIEAGFDSGNDGFIYRDDLFRGTNEPGYADGDLIATGGFSGGALQVTLGDIDDADIFDMSGGWERTFNLTAPTPVVFSFRYNLTQTPDYESDELSQALVSIAGTTGQEVTVAQIAGDGNSGNPRTTGWQIFQADLGTLAEGDYTLRIGGYNNKKTFNNESSTVLIDNVLVVAGEASPTILEAHFDGGADSFTYLDDAFLGTGAPGYASGEPITSGGFFGGALQVSLGGIDDTDIFGMSGGWQQSFTLSEPAGEVYLSFRYKMTLASDYENDEQGQVRARIGDTLSGQEFLVDQLAGNGNGGGPESTGWRFLQVNLGALEAGTHALTIGGYNDKKTFNDESTEILFDDVFITLQPVEDPTAAAQTLVESLDFNRFKQNIQTLASFGDRTQGSQSYNTAADWLEQELQGAGYAVQRHSYTFDGAPRNSIYVTKVGTKFPDHMYIVSAHLDGRGGGGAADDDGSGVSLVLEAARALAPSHIQTDISVRFIFWNNEETGLNGSQAYVQARAPLQGIEDPPGSGVYPEPSWLGIIQHDMILFDHGLPPQANQIPGADIDIEYQASSVATSQSLALATTLQGGNMTFSGSYPAEVGSDMSNTDSVPFQNLTAAVSVRENQRIAEIGGGANPHWHQATDVFSTYSEADFMLGFNALRMTLGSVADLVGIKIFTP